MSTAAWSYWEQFLDKDLDQFRSTSAPDSNSGSPLLVLQRASQRTTGSRDDSRCTAAVSSTNADDGGRILEEMLDEKRVPVQVRIYLHCIVYSVIQTIIILLLLCDYIA